MREDDCVTKIESEIDRYFSKQSTHRLCKILIGVIPPIGALLLLIHVALTLLDVNWYIAVPLFKLSVCGYMLLLVLSKLFGFCWIHRAFITYNFVISCCVDYHHFGAGFGESVDIVRAVVFFIGLLIFAKFFKEGGWKNFCKGYKD